MSNSSEVRDVAQRPARFPLPVILAAAGVIATFTLGLVVQGTAPKPPLILLADSGVFAEGSEFAGDPAFTLDYVAGPELSGNPGVGSVYEMVVEGSPEDVLSQLAPLFSLEGEPRESRDYSEAWPGYVVGDEDWENPSLLLTWKGSGSWFYTNPTAYPEPVCEEVPAEEGSEELPGWECSPADPGLELPTASEARRMAWDLFRNAGLEANFEDVVVLTDDEWGVGVSAAARVAGEKTALEWTMFWAPGPVLASATGHSATPVYRGEYETVSPRDAVDRVSSGSWWGAPPIDYDAPHDDFHAEESMVLDDSFFDQPIIITGATTTSLLIWDSDGGQWIVPGYALSYGASDFAATTVVSLTADTLRIEKPELTQPLPEPDIAQRRG
jgi:hypothetical protein